MLCDPRRTPTTQAAYQGADLNGAQDFYGGVDRETDGRTLVEEFTLPIRLGRDCDVPAGYVCGIYTVDGSRVGDLHPWNRHDPRERFWASGTRQLRATHMSTYNRP